MLDLALRKQGGTNSKYRASLSSCLETYLPEISAHYNFKAIKTATVKRFAPEHGGDPNLWEKVCGLAKEKKFVFFSDQNHMNL